jgi:predicted nucleic acid-binding protein
VTTLCDTSVVIDLLRGAAPALTWARGLPGGPWCSEITRVEILRGMRTQERRATERLFGAITWIPLDEAVARRAGELGRTFRRRDHGIATADLVIAATAMVHGHDLATINVKHFPMIAGIRAPYELR